MGLAERSKGFWNIIAIANAFKSLSLNTKYYFALWKKELTFERFERELLILLTPVELLLPLPLTISNRFRCVALFTRVLVFKSFGILAVALICDVFGPRGFSALFLKSVRFPVAASRFGIFDARAGSKSLAFGKSDLETYINDNDNDNDISLRQFRRKYVEIV